MNTLDLIGIQLVDFVFDKKTGHLEIELLDDYGGTDFLIFDVSALYFGTYSIDEDGEMDFHLIPIKTIDDIIPHIKGELISSAGLQIPKEVKKDSKIWNAFTTCLYKNNQSFKHRLSLTFMAESIAVEENEQCHAELHIDIVKCNYDLE